MHKSFVPSHWAISRLRGLEFRRPNESLQKAGSRCRGDVVGTSGKWDRFGCWCRLGKSLESRMLGTARKRVGILSPANGEYTSTQEAEETEFTWLNHSMLCNATSVQTYFRYTTLAIRTPSSKSTQTWAIPALWSCATCSVILQLVLTLFQNAIVHAPDVHSLSTPLTITILPALPSAWNTGSVTGLRVRGCMTVNVAWRNGKATSGAIVADSRAPGRSVVVVYEGRKVAAFTAEGGKTIPLNFWYDLIVLWEFHQQVILSRSHGKGRAVLM